MLKNNDSNDSLATLMTVLVLISAMKPLHQFHAMCSVGVPTESAEGSRHQQ